MQVEADIAEQRANLALARASEVSELGGTKGFVTSRFDAPAPQRALGRFLGRMTG